MLHAYTWTSCLMPSFGRPWFPPLLAESGSEGVNSRWAGAGGGRRHQSRGPLVSTQAGQWVVDILVSTKYQRKEFWPATFVACAQKMFSAISDLFPLTLNRMLGISANSFFIAFEIQRVK